MTHMATGMLNNYYYYATLVGSWYQTRGGWKEVIKTHVQALIGPNFAEPLAEVRFADSANLDECRRRL